MRDFSKRQCLVIDDFQGMRTLLRDMLRELGVARVDIAANGNEATGLLGGHRYDVVLCDYNLGNGRNGQQLLEEAKLRNLVGPACVWIMVTAEKTSEAILGAVEYQPDAYLIKPVTIATLENRLEKLWARKSALLEIDSALAAKNYSRALQLCEQRLEFDRINAAELQRLKSQILVNAGDWSAAQQVFQQVLDERELPWAKTGMAKVLFQQGQFDAARDMLKQTIEDNRSYLEAYDWLALAQQKLGDDAGAEQTLQAALKLFPKSPLRQKNLGELALKRGDSETAAQAFSKSVEVGEFSVLKSADAYVGLAQVCGPAQEKEAMKALDLLQKHLPGDETRLRAKSVAGIIYQQANNPKKAAEMAAEVSQLLQAGVLPPGNNASLETASLLLANGDRDGAVALLQSVVRNNHDNKDLLGQVQQVFVDSGMAEEGARLVEASRQEAIEIMNRGVLLAREGRLQEALDAMYQARTSLPGNVRVLFNFAFILIGYMQKNGASDNLRTDARNALLQANRLEPGDKRFTQLMDALTQLS
jgi:tetratricopeptide (TPR) repeat protein